MFSRVLVANRGEIAVRVIRALHELGIEAVAVYSTADRDALHVELADRAVCIGPPSAAESYLKIPNVVAAAETTGCEAVHPGYGFLAENPAFVRACEESDLVFIGPTADVMERMGDKVRAKEEMRAAGRPARAGDGRHRRRRGRAPDRAADRVPGAREGERGRRGKGHARRPRGGRARGRVRGGRCGGGSGVRRRLALPREGDRARAPRRDPGALRRRGRHPHARRARVLDPAPPPEADRGVALARARRRRARGDGGRGRARVRVDRLPERGNVRVPARRPTARSTSSR